jgi:hypothetical protein
VNITDHLFNGMGGSETYRALIFPELFPGHGKWYVRNWCVEDIIDYWIDMEKGAWE